MFAHRLKIKQRSQAGTRSRADCLALSARLVCISSQGSVLFGRFEWCKTESEICYCNTGFFHHMGISASNQRPSCEYYFHYCLALNCSLKEALPFSLSLTQHILCYFMYILLKIFYEAYIIFFLRHI